MQFNNEVIFQTLEIQICFLWPINTFSYHCAVLIFFRFHKPIPLFPKFIFILFLGIGRLLALKLAETGANVIAVSRTQSDLDSLKEEVGIEFKFDYYNVIL